MRALGCGPGGAGWSYREGTIRIGPVRDRTRGSTNPTMTVVTEEYAGKKDLREVASLPEFEFLFGSSLARRPRPI
jgi:hypothetical protein